MLREYPSRRYKNICWVILLAVLAAYFPTLYYTDIITTYKHSLELLNCIWEGRLFEFYLCANTYIEALGEISEPIYSLPIYVVFAVWNLPIWVLVRMGLVWHPENMWCLLWCKGLLAAATVGTCWLMCGILKQVGKKREEIEEALFLLLTSLLFAVPIMAAAQYDILCVFFILLGVWQRLRDGRLSWKVMLIFALAATFKFFALLVYVVMVLLDEKRVWRVLCALLAGAAGVLVIGLPFAQPEHTQDTEALMGGFVRFIFEGRVQAGMGDLPLFPCVMIGVCIAAYCLRPNGREQYLKTFAWLVSVTFFGFFLLARSHPYWSVLLVPFTVLVLALDPERFHLNVLLESVGSLAFLLYQAYSYRWVYLSENSLSWLLLKNIPFAGEIHDLAGIVEYWELENWMTLPYAAFAAAFAALLYLNRPQKTGGYQDGEQNTLVFQKGIYAFRVFCVFGYLLLTLGIAYVW